ncbi:MAG: DUF839 domain-containing protein [Aquincola sp.]|nr:DUF839 domain-containing protein [Aquincola sp.]
MSYPRRALQRTRRCVARIAGRATISSPDAGATTPWGTWLTCEENINGYFWNKAATDAHPDAKALKRYGAPGLRRERT